MRGRLLEKRRALCSRLGELPGDRTPARMATVRRIIHIDSLLSGATPATDLEAAWRQYPAI
jgi:hypothetical protein